MDEIIVESDEPIKVMSTWGFDDGPGARLDRRAGGVYRGHRRKAAKRPLRFDLLQIPGAGCVRFLRLDSGRRRFGNVYLDESGTWWHHDMGVERYLPLEEGRDQHRASLQESIRADRDHRALPRSGIQLTDAGLAPYDLSGGAGEHQTGDHRDRIQPISADDLAITEGLATTLAAFPYYWIHLDRTQKLGSTP